MFNLFLLQLLNGAQFGILLFLVAAGLTLVFGTIARRRRHFIGHSPT